MMHSTPDSTLLLPKLLHHLRKKSSDGMLGGDFVEYDKFKELLEKRFPEWNIYYDYSGASFWISLNDGKSSYYEIQIVLGTGVGLTNRKNILPLDISTGHDEAFDTLEEALDYIDEQT